MKSKQELLKIRRIIKKKKPDFIRQDAHKKKRLNQGWKRPKGIQSKVRLHRRGYRVRISKGYKSPQLIRGFDRTGFEPVIIHNVAQLKNINNKEQGIIIGARVGNRKRVVIVAEALKLGIKILNMKYPETFASKIQGEMQKKKQEKEKKGKEKEKKASAKGKKEEKTIEKVATEEEKREEEKKEAERILTKRAE